MPPRPTLPIFALLAAGQVLPLRARAEEIEVVAHDDRLTPTTSARDHYLASSVVRRDRLAAPGLEAGDALRDLPGIRVAQSGGLGAPAVVALRGGTPGQTAAVLAGARLDDELTGVMDLSLLPLWFLDRIEVFRGGAPFDFDRVLPGGVLLFEPRRAGGTGARLTLEAGSFGARGASLVASSSGESWTLLAGVRTFASDEDFPFDDRHGTLLSTTGSGKSRRTNADFSSREAWLTASRCTSAGSIEVVGSHFDREQGVPSLALVPTRDVRSQTRRELWAGRSTVPIDAGVELESWANLLLSSISVRDPLRELGLSAERVDVDTARGATGLALITGNGRGRRLRVSLSTEEARLTRMDAQDIDRESAPDLRAWRETARAAAAAEAPITGDFGAHAQVTGETTLEGSSSTSASAPEGSFGVGSRRASALATARAGLHAHSDRWESWLNLTRAARPPTLGERFGLSTSIRGNPSLDAETSLGAEVGGRASPFGPHRGPWFEATGFVTRTSDAIVLVRSAQGYAIPVNRQTTRVLGLELAAGSRVVGPLDVEVGATLLDPRQVEPLYGGSAPLVPFQSRATASGRLRWKHEVDSALLRRVVAELVYGWESSRTADLAALAILPAQSSLDLQVSAFGFFDAVVMRVRVADVLDSPRTDFVGYPLPGRSIHGSMEVSW